MRAGSCRISQLAKAECGLGPDGGRPRDRQSGLVVPDFVGRSGRAAPAPRESQTFRRGQRSRRSGARSGARPSRSSAASSGTTQIGGGLAAHQQRRGKSRRRTRRGVLAPRRWGNATPYRQSPGARGVEDIGDGVRVRGAPQFCRCPRRRTGRRRRGAASYLYDANHGLPLTASSPSAWPSLRRSAWLFDRDLDDLQTCRDSLDDLAPDEDLALAVARGDARSASRASPGPFTTQTVNRDPERDLETFESGGDLVGERVDVNLGPTAGQAGRDSSFPGPRLRDCRIWLPTLTSSTGRTGGNTDGVTDPGEQVHRTPWRTSWCPGKPSCPRVTKIQGQSPFSANHDSGNP